MLTERNLVFTPVKPDAPINRRPMPSTETGWRKVLQDIFNRHELELEDTPEEARANEKTIFSKALAWQGLIENCECSLVAYILHYESPPPVSYIGLQAVGTVTHCNFGTNVCRDKWYPCLVTPALANNES